MAEYFGKVFLFSEPKFMSSIFWIPTSKTQKTVIFLKQAGPSRRHIQGSKIAKRLPSVKYSFTVLENRNFLKKKFEKITYSKKMDRVAR